MWITLSGTGFWNARDVVDSVILQYLYLGDPFSITLTKGFAYYAANDSNFLILVPSSLSYIDKSNSNQSPPRTVLTASSLITSIEVSANGNAVFPPPLSFTYEYMPQLERIDAGTPVLWTGQTSIGIGTATLSVPAATDMTASPSSSTTGITFSMPPASPPSPVIVSLFRRPKTAQLSLWPFLRRHLLACPRSPRRLQILAVQCQRRRSSKFLRIKSCWWSPPRRLQSFRMSSP
jgi:hypothetical protein